MRQRISVILFLLTSAVIAIWGTSVSLTSETPAGREEVVFWHFWSGADGKVVDQIVQRFNRSQDQYFVRAVSMPGNNFDMKLFLAITGGDPPDLINQDDPIVADWAHRGALYSMEEIASAEEVDRMKQWLLPAARSLGEYDGKLFAVCNGLDIRALYFNQDLVEAGLQRSVPPLLSSTDELDAIAQVCTKYQGQQLTQVGYLPDPRRLWAWGPAFGGDFYNELDSEFTADDDAIVRALDWMVSYRRRLGAHNVATFRQNDQSLPNKMFPLLANRYAVVLDGQWRVRDIEAAQNESLLKGQQPTRFGVWPLPHDPAFSGKAGWVNGNVFLVPRHSKQSEGAWEFIKFWTGLDGQQDEAAKTCIAGGWIPVAKPVSDSELFQAYLEEHPLFERFVAFSQTEQVPTPLVPGAARYYREINNLVQRAMYSEEQIDLKAELELISHQMQKRLSRLEDRSRIVDGGGRNE